MTELPIVIDEQLYHWQAEFMGISPTGEGVVKIPSQNYAKCGTKAGKTLGCALGLFTRMVSMPDTRWCWTAPVNKQLEPTWSRYFKPLAMGIPRSLVKIRDAYGMWAIELKPTNSTIVLKSGDEPWNLRGDEYDGTVIDEAAHYQLESYYSVLTNLTSRAGILWAISTPKAKITKGGQTWFDSGFAEGLRQKRLDNGDERTHSAVRVPTWSNPKPEIQQWVKMIKKMAESGTLPGGITHFRREYAAEDIEGDSAVFRFVQKLHTEQPKGPEPGKCYVIGWDPAARQDASVISIWDTSTRCEVHLEYMMQVPVESQFERLQHLWNLYGKPMGRVDATTLAGELLLNELRKRNLPLIPVKFNQYTKAQYVQHLALAMEREEPRFIDDTIGVVEMEAFGFEILPSGVIRYGAPQGQRDDTVTARYLAWMELSAGSVQVF